MSFEGSCGTHNSVFDYQTTLGVFSVTHSRVDKVDGDGIHYSPYCGLISHIRPIPGGSNLCYFSESTLASTESVVFIRYSHTFLRSEPVSDVSTETPTDFPFVCARVGTIIAYPYSLVDESD